MAPRTRGRSGAASRRAASLPVLLVALLVVALGLVLPAGPVAAVPAADPDAPVTLVLFHGEGCPHCAAEQEWLAGLAERHPELVVELYEVWYDEGNRALLEETAQRLGFDPVGVPVTVVGDRVWIGFDDARAAEIEAVVSAALEGATASPGTAVPEQPEQSAMVVEVPLLGETDLSSSSLLVSTLVIGFVDGVNPCSLWVLSVLLAIVLHSGSRRRVLLVGTTFLTVTAAMYALYVVGMYSALDYVGELGWIRVVVAAVAAVFGLLQLKDGIAPGTGPSLSLSTERRPELFRRMRGVALSDRGLAGTVAGTVVLAVGVSLLETPCTAGLPLMWTSMLARADVSLAAAVLLFAAYMAVFLLDELVVFVAAVVTLRAAKVQERHGRLLKLVAGSVLLALAVTMLVAPAALESLVGAAAVFGAAAALTAVLWLVVRARTPETTHPSAASRR